MDGIERTDVRSDELTSLFIEKLEHIAKEQSAGKELLNYRFQDDAVLKRTYIQTLVEEARELLFYNEWLIALENTIDNLYEVDIKLDKETIDLARRAFGVHIKDYAEILDEFVK